ncbi:MAG: hypothetical protein QXI19_12110 [Candidatus Caldarchaeum sp.]
MIAVLIGQGLGNGGDALGIADAYGHAVPFHLALDALALPGGTVEDHQIQDHQIQQAA